MSPKASTTTMERKKDMLLEGYRESSLPANYVETTVYFIQDGCYYFPVTLSSVTFFARMTTPHKPKPVEPLPLKRKRPEALTEREQEILQLIWAGLKNKEIAQQLKISVKTVEAHRANMMKKVRVSNAAQLLNAAIQEGMIQIK